MGVDINVTYFNAISKVRLANRDEFHRICAELDDIDTIIYQKISAVAKDMQYDYGDKIEVIRKLAILSQEKRYYQETIEKYGGREALSSLILEHMCYIIVFWELKQKEKEDNAYRDKKSCEEHFAKRANEIKAKEFAKFIDTAVANLAPKTIITLTQIMSRRM